MSSIGSRPREKLSSISNVLLTDCLRLGASFRAQGQHKLVDNNSPVLLEQSALGPRATECSKQCEVEESVLSKKHHDADVPEAASKIPEVLESPAIQLFTSGHWEYHCGIRLKWVQVDAEEDLILKEAFLKSKQSVRSGVYHVHSVPYEVDFSTMRRKNLATAKERHVRFVGELPFSPPPRSKQPVQKKVSTAPIPEPEIQPQEGYSESSSLYVVDDKREHVYIWLLVGIGNMLHRAKAGHVEVDITQKSIEARVLHAERKQTLTYRWVRLREIDVAHSSWRASQDGDRLVIKLAKSSIGMQPWKTIFESPEPGKQYFRFSQESWPDTIGLVQGCWRIVMDVDADCDNIEDALPCRAIVFGFSVVIFGHHDFLQRRQLSFDKGSLTLTEDGERFQGKVAKKGGRIDWDDGEVWSRDKALGSADDISYELLSQEALHIEPSSTTELEDSCIRLSLDVEEDTTTRFGQQQKELLAMLMDDNDMEVTEQTPGILELKASQPLPANLLSRIRVCCLDSQELTPQAVPLTLARLQREMPLADATEIAALSCLQLSLRWFSEFLGPAQRATLDASVSCLQLLLEEARLRRSKSAQSAELAPDVRKSFPKWWVSMPDVPLAKIATDLLRDELRNLRPSGRFANSDGEPSLAAAFASARKAVAAQIWSVTNPVHRIRCFREEVARARRFATLSMSVLAERGGWVDFNDSGLLVLPTTVDWTTLLIATQEAERWFENASDQEETGTRIECSSIDLLQKGHRCLYACARICRLALAHAGITKLTREAGMSPGDGFLFLEKELLQNDGETDASAFICIAPPESAFATWQFAMPGGLPDRSINLSGGMLVVCRREPHLAETMPHVGVGAPLWIRVSV